MTLFVRRSAKFVCFAIISIFLIHGVFAGGQAEGAGAEEAEAAKTTLTFWSATAAENPEVRQVYENIVSDFESDNPDIDVQLEMVSYDVMRQKLQAAVNAGDPPDIAEAGGLGLKLVLEGNAVNLKPYVEENPGPLENFSPGIRATYNIQNGEVWWGIPWRDGGHAWGGRKDIIEEYGYSPEDIVTWSDMLEAARDMTRPDENLYGVAVYGTSGDLEQYWGVAKTFNAQKGDDPFMKQTSQGWRSNLDNPRTRASARFYTDWVTRYDIAHPSSPSLSDEDAATLNGKGEVAMLTQIGDRRYKLNFPELYEQGQFIAWGIPRLSTELGDQYPDRYPEIVGEEGHHGAHLWVYEQSNVVFDSPEAAYKLLAYGAQPEYLLAIAEAYGQAPSLSVPALEECAYGEEYDFGPIAKGQARANLENIENVTPTGWPIPETDTIRWELINQNLSRVLAGEMSADEAMQKAHEEINSLMSEGS